MESQDSRRLPATLDQLARQGADIAQIAAVIVFAWSEIETVLLPIIGKGGFAALYERTLFQTRLRHPWLSAVPENVKARMDLLALKAVIERQGSVAAAAGGGAHLQALYELLGTLIGPSLTERLLSPTWSHPFTGLPAAQDFHP